MLIARHWGKLILSLNRRSCRRKASCKCLITRQRTKSARNRCSPHQALPRSPGKLSMAMEGCHSFLVVLSRGTQLVTMEVPKREVRQNGKRMLSFSWETCSSMPSCKILKTQ